MATRLRKGRHLRASRTHGWGTSGQHRGTGMQGGAGNAGRYRHKRSRLIRTGEYSHMHYAGKKGFTSIANMRPAGKTINLWQLSELADKLTAEKKAEKAGEKVIVDLKQLGFSKLLGTGSISRAVQVKVDKCSEGARKKIEDAGGEAVLRAQPTPTAPAK
ncbi:MAG: uL15 family ribosomal protein [Candidatus Bathyarchaeia archaeon]